MTEATIRVRDLSRHFRQTAAISNLNLTIRQGELFGIVGPDGSGKTTLLRMMAAVLNPTEGRLLVGNFDSFKQAENIKNMMGYMPQQFGLYGDLSVAENLNFAAEVFGIYGDTRARRMAELYAFTRLGDFKERKAGLLSGGMKKKLGLACALIHRPQVLLLDEPTTGVDPVARRDFWDLLSGLHAQGTTTVVSTPYMDEAERCNRVALLYEGQLLACDTPQNIKVMIPGKVLAVEGENVHRLAHTLGEIPSVMEVQTYGDQLNLIISGEVEQARKTIQERLAQHQAEALRIEEVPVRMEEAFIYLVNRERQQEIVK